MYSYPTNGNAYLEVMCHIGRQAISFSPEKHYSYFFHEQKARKIRANVRSCKMYSVFHQEWRAKFCQGAATFCAKCELQPHFNTKKTLPTHVKTVTF